MIFDEHIKSAADGAAIGSGLLGMLNIVPHMTSFLGLIWLIIRIWETDTVQKAIGRLRKKKQEDQITPHVVLRDEADDIT